MLVSLARLSKTPLGSARKSSVRDLFGLLELLECLGPIVYRVALPPRSAGTHVVLHVSVLRRCVFDPSHILDFTALGCKEDLSFQEQPVRILGRETKGLHSQVISFVKAQWSHRVEREAT